MSRNVLRFGLSLIALFLTLAVISPAAGSDDRCEVVPVTTYAGVSWSEESFSFRLTGAPGQPGYVTASFAPFGGTSTQVEVFEFTVVFDANGVWEASGDLHDFDNSPGFDLVFTVTALDLGGKAVTAEGSTFRMRRFPTATAPVSGNPSSGGSGMAALPGTLAPLHPWSWAAFAMPVGGVSETLIFLASLTGIEGVFPIN